jgi:hypothetical protein
VLAGTAAAEAAAGADPGDFGFCGARPDASDAEGMEYLAPRSYVNASVALRDNWDVAGLTPAEGVALAARPRSAAYYRLLGYSGSWGGSPGELSNAYFSALLAGDWRPARSAAGRDEFVDASGGGGVMGPDDVAILADAELRAIAAGYAVDNGRFLAAYAAAWTKAMNADRLDGPASNACDGDEPAPSVASS